MRHYYRLSPLVWVSTGIAYVTLVGILIYFIYEGLGIEMYLFILAIILLTSITVLWKPVYYEWQPDGLRLRLLAFEKFYSYEDYEIEEDGTMKGRITLRLFGSGGFFGYLGYFWVRKRGVSLCYLAHESKPILRIHKKGRKRSIFINGEFETGLN